MSKANPHPSAILLAARLKSGAGKHGGSAKAKNRRNRQDAKRSLKEYR